MPSKVFEAQAALLVRTLPYVAAETCFALKGGTAINLFIRDLPRLSVDIDLVYLPIADREASLLEIRSALGRIAQSIRKAIPGSVVTENAASDGTRIVVRYRSAQTKIEVTPVLRGTVHPVELRTVCPSAEERFGFAEIQVVSFADLYAGKMVAALDRQHPRDLFDIQYLLAKEGVSDTLFQTFLVYILSHNRPAHEVLQPHLKDIKQAFAQEFVGMTIEETSLDVLIAARAQLISEIRSHLDERAMRFVLSFHELKPDWALLETPDISNLPAIRWKLMNLALLQAKQPEKYRTMIHELETLLPSSRHQD
jgi:predicted nucleotidyltransferase component of viral defense system